MYSKTQEHRQLKSEATLHRTPYYSLYMFSRYMYIYKYFELRKQSPNNLSGNEVPTVCCLAQL